MGKPKKKPFTGYEFLFSAHIDDLEDCPRIKGLFEDGDYSYFDRRVRCARIETALKRLKDDILPDVPDCFYMDYEVAVYKDGKRLQDEAIEDFTKDPEILEHIE